LPVSNVAYQESKTEVIKTIPHLHLEKFTAGIDAHAFRIVFAQEDLGEFLTERSGSACYQYRFPIEH
jgi:hypothetical protein